MRWLVALMLATPAVAQDAVDEAFCAELTTVFPVLSDFGAGLPRSFEFDGIRADGEMCVYDNVVITTGFDPVQGIDGDWPDDGALTFQEFIEELRLSGTGLERMLTGAYPTSVDLRIEGYYATGAPGSFGYDLGQAIQAKFDAWDIALVADFDASAQRLHVSELTLDMQRDWRFSGSAEVAGLDMSDLNAVLRTAPLAEVTAFDFELSGSGIFEHGAIALVGWRLSLMPDPEAAFVGMVEDGIEVVENAPVPVVGTDSKAALVELLSDLPHPTGAVRVAVEAEPGLGMARFAPFVVTGPPETVEEFGAVLGGVRVVVEYFPQGE